MQKTLLVDPITRKAARVLNGGALEVVQTGVPTQGQQQKAILYRDYFRDSSGAFDMRVDGSTNSVEFTIEASDDKNVDRYITSLSFQIADQNATLSQFGNIGALTNGVDVEYRNNIIAGGIVSLSLEGLKSNWDFIRLANGKPAFGTGASAFQATNVSGNSEGYIPVVDIDEIFGLPYGIVLRGNTNDKFVIRINDNVSGVDAFTCVASGIDRIGID